MTTTYSSLPDLAEVAQQAVENNLNPYLVDPESALFKHAPNALTWCISREFVGINPYPRQTQIMTNLHEEYCPLCSDMDVVRDMWGYSTADLTSKVAFLDRGTCPSCGKNKCDFRAADLLSNYNELVGVAGMRCLHPDTLIQTPASLRKIKDLQVGDVVLAPSEKETTTVSERRVQYHPGHFIITYGDGKQYICGDSHYWIVHRKGETLELPTVELLAGDELYVYNRKTRQRVPGFEIKKVEKRYKPITLYDIRIPGELYLGQNNEVLHNSGKSALVGMLASYHLHRLLMLPNSPALYYGLTANSQIQITFVATTATQASETLWQSFLDMLNSSSWIKEYRTHLDRKKNEDGRERYKWLEYSINFLHKRLLCKFSPADQAGLRGRTRAFAAIDELGWFFSDTSRQRASGMGTYAALAKSLKTIRTKAELLKQEGKVDPLTGLMCNIGSPQDDGDCIMSLLYKSMRARSMYGVHYATWEFNPYITQEGLADEFLVDPVATWRDFGAQPPASNEAFIAGPENVDALIDQQRRVLTNVDIVTFTRNVRDNNYKYVKPVLPKFQADPGTGYLVTCDAGETDNCFAIMVSHWNRDLDKGIIDIALEIEPLVDAAGDPVAVHFPSALDFILGGKTEEGKPAWGLADYLNIWYVVYDRWQSTDHIQSIRDHKILSDKVSLTFENLKEFRARIYSGQWIIPRPEADPKEHPEPSVNMPILRLLRQSKRVRQVGLKVMKPSTGSDDLFRAWALADYIFAKKMKNYQEFCSTLHPRAHRQGRPKGVILVQQSKTGESMNPTISRGSQAVPWYMRPAGRARL